jgi:hypothetical protein
VADLGVKLVDEHDWGALHARLRAAGQKLLKRWAPRTPRPERAASSSCLNSPVVNPPLANP